MNNEEEPSEHNISSQNSSESICSRKSDYLEDKRSRTRLIRRNKPPKIRYFKNPSGFVSIYITSCEKDESPKVELHCLQTAVPNLNLSSSVETNYGLIINLTADGDVKKILNLDLAKVFGKPVQVVPLFSGHFQKNICFKEVPWCIRVEEIEICLRNQGIRFDSITRDRSMVFVELPDFSNFHKLREEGINFYNSVVFRASDDSGINDDLVYSSDNIIQCYRCQGFWHTANTCKQNIRCVRCGEEHSVENCNRPKHSPICCNCRGDHHAAYKLCPVRQKLKKSVRVSFSFSQ